MYVPPIRRLEQGQPDIQGLNRDHMEASDVGSSPSIPSHIWSASPSGVLITFMGEALRTKGRK